MPYLNWKTASIEQEVGTHSHREFQLQLKMDPAQLRELLPQLEDVFLHEGSELRLDLPQEWIVFWKRREGESRLLMAHPQENEWVSTIALGQAHGEKLMEGLRALQAGQSLALSSLGEAGSVSNVEVLITIR